MPRARQLDLGVRPGISDFFRGRAVVEWTSATGARPNARTRERPELANGAFVKV